MMRKSKGFTLIELMVTIGVLAIIATLAAPSFSETLSNQKLKKMVTEITYSLHSARSQALLTRLNTIVCINHAGDDEATARANCGANLPNYLTMKSSSKESNIFIVNLEGQVNLDSSIKDDVFIFDSRGKTTAKTVKLCGTNKSQTIKLFIPGSVEYKTGGAC